MKAIAKTSPEYGDLEIIDVSAPELQEDEVLVEVREVGVCGSDVGIYAGKGTYEFVDTPRILGHEYSGMIVDTGQDVTGLEKGDRVVERPLRPCRECKQCQLGNLHLCEEISATGFHHDGAFTDLIAVPQDSIHKIPSDLPYRTAAVLEPTSVAVRAVTKNSRVRAGDEVLVEGPGPIGMLAAQVARIQGADVTVTGVGADTEYRLPLAAEYGFSAYDVQAQDISDVVDERTDGSGFDVIIDATGHPSGLEGATNAVENGGQIVLVGIPGTVEFDVSEIVRSEVQIQCSYTSLWEDFEAAVKLLQSGRVDVDPLIDEYSAEKPKEAFDDFKQGKTIKPMFSFNSK